MSFRLERLSFILTIQGFGGVAFYGVGVLKVEFLFGGCGISGGTALGFRARVSRIQAVAAGCMHPRREMGNLVWGSGLAT